MVLLQLPQGLLNLRTASGPTPSMDEQVLHRPTCVDEALAENAENAAWGGWHQSGQMICILQVRLRENPMDTTMERRLTSQEGDDMFTTQNTLLGAAYRRLVAGVCGLLVALLASSLNPAGAQGQAHASASMAELEAKVKELGGQRFGGKTIAEIAEMTEKVQDELFDQLNEKDEYRAHKVLGQYKHTLGLR